MKPHHFFTTLCVRSELLGPAPAQAVGILQGHECQKVRITGSPLGGWLLLHKEIDPVRNFRTEQTTLGHARNRYSHAWGRNWCNLKNYFHPFDSICCNEMGSFYFLGQFLLIQDGNWTILSSIVTQQPKSKLSLSSIT